MTRRTRSPFLTDPESETHRRVDGYRSVLLQLWVPQTLRGQLRELAAQESNRLNKRVTMADLVRRGARHVIQERLALLEAE